MNDPVRTYSGPASPDGAVFAEAGSVYLRVVDGAISFFYKAQGESADGWISVSAGGGGGGAAPAGNAGDHQINNGSAGFSASKLNEVSSSGTTTVTGKDSTLFELIVGDAAAFNVSLVATAGAAAVAYADAGGHQVTMGASGFSDSAATSNTLMGWASTLNAISIPHAFFDQVTGAINLGPTLNSAGGAGFNVSASVTGSGVGLTLTGAQVIANNETTDTMTAVVGLEVGAASNDGGGSATTTTSLLVIAATGSANGSNFGIQIQDAANAADFAIKTGVGLCEFGDAVKIDGHVGFYGTAPVAKSTVSGSKGANAALASLMTALSGLGLVTDTTS